MWRMAGRPGDGRYKRIDWRKELSEREKSQKGGIDVK